MAPGRIVPPPDGMRHPCTRSNPSRSFARIPGALQEVVAVVRVPHDDELATGGADPTHQRTSLAAGPDVHQSRSVVLGNPCEPSLAPLSATTTSPAIPFLSGACAAYPMHAPGVSASFRQGMTIDSSIPPPA